MNIVYLKQAFDTGSLNRHVMEIWQTNYKIVCLKQACDKAGL